MVTLEKIIINEENLNILDEFIAFDVETSGISHNDRIIELGAVRFCHGIMGEEYDSLVNPGFKINSFITGLTGITNEMLEASPSEDMAYADFMFYFKDVLDSKIVMVAHNATFDANFISRALTRMGYSGHIRYVDTLQMSRKFLKELPNHKLNTVGMHFNIVNEREHRGYADAAVCGKIAIQIRNIVKGL